MSRERDADGCAGEPISHLRLEQFHLGELAGEARSLVEHHLAGCPSCAAELRRIAAADEHPLPGLGVPAAARRRPTAGEVVALQLRRAAPVLGAFALAAAIFVAVGKLPTVDGEDDDGERIKGSDIALTLVRERDGTIDEAGTSFDPADRLKVLVTCPPKLKAAWDVVVFDESGATFPLDPTQELACGNEIALPGAFRLTGTSAQTVCLVWNTDRDELKRTRPERLARSRCTSLAPVAE